jgi:hypothetical protein
MMSKHRQRMRARRRSEEGAVMLIVMLILLTATTLAATSLQTTQFELRSSGYNRAALQTQYISEAAASTTLAWVDATALDRSFLRHLDAWNNNVKGPPDMSLFGEPLLNAATRANSNRTQWRQQSTLSTVGIPPLTLAGFTNTNNTFTDPVGTLGPRSAYTPGLQPGGADPLGPDYVVDMYDCRQLPNTAAVGYQINQGGSGVLKQVQYYCVVTSRGRSYVPYPTSVNGRPTKKWTVPGAVGSADYIVNRFTMAHDSRGTLVTPPIIQQ